ncbi:MAG TPA: hypothetical protein VGJ15_07950 [Pirellulales bacterium]
MSPTRIEPKLAPIELDLSAAFSFETGFGRAELLGFGPQLELARVKLSAKATDSCEPNTTAANSVTQAQRLLSQYKAQRKASVLGQILAISKQLREVVDRVVVLAPPQFTTAANALFAACCHPLHNELSRGQRGGRPRIYLLPALPDNDAVQAMLEILPRGKQLATVDERWGIVAAGNLTGCNDDELLTGLFILLWDGLQTTTTADDEKQLAAVVAAPGSSLATLANEIGIPRIEPLAAPSLQETIHFQPGMLLAAAVMGMDIVKLLRGAAAMAKRFIDEPPGNNPALDFAGLSHLLAVRRGIYGRRIETIAGALRPTAACISHPRSDNDLLVQLTAQAVRHDRLRVTIPSGQTAGGHAKLVDRLLVDVAQEQATAVKTSRINAAAPTATIQLPVIDESTVGQVIAMFSLAEEIQTHLAM